MLRVAALNAPHLSGFNPWAATGAETRMKSAVVSNSIITIFGLACKCH